MRLGLKHAWLTLYTCGALVLPMGSHATAPICQSTMTPEQAYLTIRGKAVAPIAKSTAASLPTLPRLININTASESELAQLDGIGAKKAQDIILYREMMGGFTHIDDLDNVKGIGKATVDKNRHRLTVR